MWYWVALIVLVAITLLIALGSRKGYGDYDDHHGHYGHYTSADSHQTGPPQGTATRATTTTTTVTTASQPAAQVPQPALLNNGLAPAANIANLVGAARKTANAAKSTTHLKPVTKTTYIEETL